MTESTLTPESVAERRVKGDDPGRSPRLMFRVAALYGISTNGMRMPLNEIEGIQSGPISITMDPEAASSCNLGVIDYDQRLLKVRYGAQLVFPGLFELIRSRRYDPSLLRPVRATATDECTLTENFGGWRALGCLDFLPAPCGLGQTEGETAE